jgi:hypothetical protein
MTFLAPTALLGMLLLALPILVHLFKPRKMRRTPFSSLRWLKETHQRLSRRIRWHRWLLFLLRAGFVALLVLALARPLVGFRGEGRPADRFIILDVGRSMSYSAGGLPSPLERARGLAERLLEQTKPGDRTALVLAGGETRLAVPLAADNAGALAALRAVPAAAAENPVSAVLPVVRSLCRDPDRDVELVFVTSNRQQSWRQADVQGFLAKAPGASRVQVIDVGPGGAQNAWIAGARVIQREVSDERLIRVELGCVGESRQARTLRLRGVAGLGDEAQDVVLSPGRRTSVDFKIPTSVNLAGQVAELRLEPADALPDDDHFFLNLDVPWALRVLLIEPEPSGPGPQTSGLFLRKGLDVLTATDKNAVDLVSRSSASIAPADVRRADVVLLAGVPKLSDAVLESLEGRVRAGAGLVVFLGNGLDPSFYTQKLFKPLQPAEGLLPVPLKTGPQGLHEGPGYLTGIRWSHPLLAPLHDPRNELPRCPFLRFASFAEAPGKGDTVLAWIDDREPALIERPLGAGRVLLWNTSADRSWSDLPVHGFVPLLDRTLSYLAAGARRRQFTAGEAIVLPPPRGESADGLTVVTPNGTRLVPRRESGGGQTVLHLEPVPEAGVYRAEMPGNAADGFAFAVNVSRDSSPLAPADEAALRQWWQPASLEVLGADAAAERYADAPAGWPLWPLLVFLGCLLLLAETVYVHRLCPRLNPPPAAAVVHERGLLKPLHDAAR